MVNFWTLMRNERSSVEIKVFKKIVKIGVLEEAGQLSRSFLFPKKLKK